MVKVTSGQSLYLPRALGPCDSGAAQAQLNRQATCFGDHSPACKFVLRIIKDVDIVYWRAKKSHTIQVIVVPSFNAAVQYNAFILPIPPNRILPCTLQYYSA
jgi:hypothetical protein